MQKIAFISPQPETGKTTAMINTGAGLHLRGKRVLLSPRDNDVLFNNWLQHSLSTEQPSILRSDIIGVDILQTPSLETTCLNNYDYHLLEVGNEENNLIDAARAAGVIICCIAVGHNDLKGVIELNHRLQKLTGGQKEINLIVPGMARAGEWENNSQQLFELVEIFGEERVADIIPHCEAIHDLPLLQQHVWMLPDHYRNRKDAFNRLLDRIEQI